MPTKDREKQRAAVRRYQARDPERTKRQRAAQDAKRKHATDPKLRARRLVQKARARGRIVVEPCLFCDSPDVHAHHHDYSQPLAVTWLCALHHGLVHRLITEEAQAA